MIPISIQTHVKYADIYYELMDFRDMTMDPDINFEHPFTIGGFGAFVYERFYHDTKPFWEYTLDEVCDENDDRYPNDKWLASIVDTCRRQYKESFEHGDILLEQIKKAWFFGYDEDVFRFDEESKVLTAYTSGWSGCEDIIYALSLVFPWIDVHKAVMTFDMRYFFKEEKDD